MNNSIKTTQVFSLLLLELAIIISWIAYHEYQPILVVKFQLEEYAKILMVAQGIILTLTPIIAGNIADKIRDKNGSSLPIFNFGISATAMIFMSVALTVFTEPQGLVRFILPFLIVFWLISMNIFRSPAISLIEYFVPQSQIPKVYAYFVILANIGYALEPLIVNLVQFFGGTLTFVVGGILVFGTGTLLKQKSLLISPSDITNEFNNDTEDGKSNYFLVLIAALVMGIFTTFIFKYVPNLINTSQISLLNFSLPIVPNGNLISSLLVIFSAIVTFIISRFINNQKVQSLLIVGVLLGIISMISISMFHSPLILMISLIFFSFTFALVSLTSLPFALYKLGTKNTILGLGIFFGAIELVDSLYEILSTF